MNEICTFSNKHIIVTSVSPQGNIKWVQTIPKSQEEEIVGSWGAYVPEGADTYSFFGELDWPYYASFLSLIRNNQLILLMNDHILNQKKPTAADRIQQMIGNYSDKSAAYAISFDLRTGKSNREQIFVNNPEKILKLRFGITNGNDIYLSTWEENLRMPINKIKAVKISMK